MIKSTATAKTKLLGLIGISILAILFTRCQKEPVLDPRQTQNTPTIHDEYKFSTTSEITISVRLLSNFGQALKGVPVIFYSGTDSVQLLKAVTDHNGYISTSLRVASYLRQLIVVPNYAGLVSSVRANIVACRLGLTIGGTAGITGNISFSQPGADFVKQIKGNLSTISTSNYRYMGEYDANGRPAYLETQSGPVGVDFLSFINYSLPSGQDIRVRHSDYLAASAGKTLDIKEPGDVFITFVSESAGNMNSCGFYTYPTGNPPASAADIGSIQFIFPNSSAFGSSGGLLTGDRVKLGHFNAGTSIAFVLFAYGWNSTSKLVNGSAPKFYSNEQFNPETGQLKRHTVILKYGKDLSYVIGFEDLNRETKSCDHDFNDLVLYASSSPATAISEVGIAPLDVPVDTDKDGVNDVFDEFPTDASKAYTNYYPSKSTLGTLAFEDNWPMKGDYDMNDMVVNYRYIFVNNAANEVVELTGKYAVPAAFAMFKNGFGVQFPFSSSVVSCVSGYKLSAGYVQLNANGTEAGQNNAVIIPFDNHEVLTTNNAQPGDTVSVVLKFSLPQALVSVASAPFNPFLISNGRRGYEVHLPGYLPTDKATVSLFGKNDDRSDPAAGNYYLDINSRPWALHFIEPFKFPVEGKAIDAAYLHFNEWASSGGLSYPGWYKNTSAGYRNNDYIFK